MAEQVLMKYKYYYYKLLIAKLILPEVYDSLYDFVTKLLKNNIRISTEITGAINKIQLRLTHLVNVIDLGRDK